MDWSGFFAFTITGLFTGAAYAIAASGLVLTYSTTRVFNIAHGALGMIFSFVFWDFSQRQGLPIWLSLFLVLFVVAPAFGVFIGRFVARDLGGAPVSVGLVVTVALTVGLIGVATKVWPSEARFLPLFYPDKKVTLPGDVVVTYHQLITMVVAGIVAFALYVLLARTRVGTAMRASVDNPDLLQLYGGRPRLVASLAWAIGTSLAALGGILLAPVIGLQYYELTLLVISAYAAAMLGKLTNLPMTFLGAMVLGVAQAYVIGYNENIPFAKDIPGLNAVIPTIFLFAILVLLPQAPLRIGQVKGLVSAPVPSLPKTGLWAGIAFVVIVLLSITLDPANLLLAGTALAFGILMLSLVLLTGYGGFVSLAQFTFAGVGAIAYAQFGQWNLLGLVLSALVAALVGGIVAIPVLRLTGLYLALATLAFAQLTEKTFFQASYAFAEAKQLRAEHLSLFGFGTEGTGSAVVVTGIFFLLTAVFIVVVRRGRVGRMLIASRDSQAACGTLGLDLRWFRVGLFAASAGIAGAGGALLIGLRENAVANDFLQFKSLLLLLAVVVWGVTSVTGAAAAGVFLMYLNNANEGTQGILFVILAVGAILLAKDPNGLANKVFGLSRFVQDRLFPFLAEKYPGMALPGSRAGAEDDEAIGPIDDTSVIPAVHGRSEGEGADDVVAAR